MLTYNEMKISVIDDLSYDVNIRRIFKKADSLIEGKDIELFYMKNLFLGCKEFELYLFCDDNIIVKIGLEDEKFITSSIYNKNSIDKVTLKENNTRSNEKILEIKFKNCETFKFNSVSDSDLYTDLNLASRIEHIFKNITVMKNI
jgi:hypothetical protein